MLHGLRPRARRGSARAASVALGLGLALFLSTACGADAEPAAPRERAPADDAAPAIPADAPLVVFLGDSLAAGLHIDPEDAFPAVLQRRLAAAGLPFRLINAGVSGDTTAGGRSRIDWLLRQEPDVVVVELGGNDGLRGQPLESVEANLRAILERVQAAGARPLLFGMNVPTSYGEEYARGFAALYPRLAESLDVALVPTFLEGVGAIPAMNLPDGIHPTPAGHERLADNAADELAELLQSLDGE